MARVDPGGWDLSPPTPRYPHGRRTRRGRDRRLPASDRDGRLAAVRAVARDAPPCRGACRRGRPADRPPRPAASRPRRPRRRGGAVPRYGIAQGMPHTARMSPSLGPASSRVLPRKSLPANRFVSGAARGPALADYGSRPGDRARGHPAGPRAPGLLENGKPAERRGRKVTRLPRTSVRHAGRAAEGSRDVEHTLRREKACGDRDGGPPHRARARAR